LVKKSAAKPKREISKRQLARWQKEKKRQRLIFIIGSAIIVAVLIFLGIGWYTNYYRPRHQTVIKVNDTEYDMNYYIKKFELIGKGQSIYYLYAVADDVERTIQQDELIRQNAMKLGISVSDDEIDELLEDYEDSTSAALRDAVRSQLLMEKLGEEYFEPQVPVYTEQRHVRAMFLDSETEADEVRDRLKAGEDFAELAGELSWDDYTRARDGDLGWHPENVLTGLLGGSVPAGYAFGADVGDLSQPLYDEERSKGVGYWLIRVTDRREDPKQVYAHAILLGSEEEAWRLKEEIESGGDLAALAEEYSQHPESKDKGGDIGWVESVMVSEAFAEFAFDFDVTLGLLSEPIRDEEATTIGGYWLVEVLEKDDSREITQGDRELIKGGIANEWMAALWNDPENEIAGYMDTEQKRWAADKAFERLD